MRAIVVSLLIASYATTALAQPGRCSPGEKCPAEQATTILNDGLYQDGRLLGRVADTILVDDGRGIVFGASRFTAHGDKSRPVYIRGRAMMCDLPSATFDDANEAVIDMGLKCTMVSGKAVAFSPP